MTYDWLGWYRNVAERDVGVHELLACTGSANVAGEGLHGKAQLNADNLS